MKTKFTIFLLFLFSILLINVVSADTETIDPDSAGYHQEWDLVDTSHWEATNDDSDSTYITGNVEDERDLQNLENMTVSEATISEVRITVRVRAFGGGGSPERFKILYRTYDSDWVGTTLTAERTQWWQHNKPMVTNPVTDQAWTVAEVNDLEAGIIVDTIGSGEEIRCSEIWVRITYTVAGQEYQVVINETMNIYDVFSFAKGTYYETTITEKVNIFEKPIKDVTKVISDTVNILDNVVKDIELIITDEVNIFDLFTYSFGAVYETIITEKISIFDTFSYVTGTFYETVITEKILIPDKFVHSVIEKEAVAVGIGFVIVWGFIILAICLGLTYGKERFGIGIP